MTFTHKIPTDIVQKNNVSKEGKLAKGQTERQTDTRILTEIAHVLYKKQQLQ